MCYITAPRGNLLSSDLAQHFYSSVALVRIHCSAKYPVVEDEDIDPEFLPQCRLENTERMELLAATTIIFWDEFVSNARAISANLQSASGSKIYICLCRYATMHRYCLLLLACLKACLFIARLLAFIVATGDVHQILPGNKI